MAGIDPLLTLSCGPRHWPDSVVSLASYLRCIFCQHDFWGSTCGSTFPECRSDRTGLFTLLHQRLFDECKYLGTLPCFSVECVSSSSCDDSPSLVRKLVMAVAASTTVEAETTGSSAMTHSPCSEDIEHSAGRFRNSARALASFFWMTNDRYIVNVNKNVVRSPRLKRRRSRSETPSWATAAPLRPPPLVLSPTPPPPTVAVKVKTGSEANEEPTDFQQVVASWHGCETGEWRHGFAECMF